MNIVSLEEVKDYLSIDKEYNDENNFLINLINIAESTVFAQINGGIIDEGITETPENSIMNYRYRLKGVILMLVSELYNQRELQTSSNLKETPVFKYILSTLTKFGPF